MHDTLLIYSDASTLSSSALMSFSLAVPLTSLEHSSRTATFIDLYTIIQDPDFGAPHFNIQVKSLKRCQKLSSRMVEGHMQ